MNAVQSTVETRDPPGPPGRRSPVFGCRLARPPDTELARLKDRLLREKLPEHTEAGLERLVRLAATEAEALSWLTPFPLLVLPVLLDEKLEGVQRYAKRQRRLLRRALRC